MKNLIVIPARGGSKGLKDKNLRILHDKSLTSWAIHFAKQISNSDVCVSSDSQRILEEASNSSVISLIRPDRIAADTTRDFEVLIHALEACSKLTGQDYKLVIMIQPTAPGRSLEEFNAALEVHRVSNPKYSATWSVVKVPSGYNPQKQITLDETNRYSITRTSNLPPRRQDLSQTFIRNGDFYILERDAVYDPYLAGSNLNCYVSNFPMVNIDDEADLIKAHRLCYLSKGQLKRREMN